MKNSNIINIENTINIDVCNIDCRSNGNHNHTLSDNFNLNNTISKIINKKCKILYKIWLVIPCLNSSKTINETLESIFSQEGDFILYLHVQDGCSSDNTLDIVESWRQRTKKTKSPKIIISIKSTKDKGLYDAINKGFKQLKPQDDGFMSWLNSDDILKPGALNTIIEISKNFPYIHWICGNRSVINDDGSIYWESSIAEFSRIYLYHGLCDSIHYLFFQQEGTFWRGWLWKKVGGVNSNLKLAGDYELWVKFSKIAEIYSVNQNLASFRMRHNSLSSNTEGYLTEIDSILPQKKRENSKMNLLKHLNEGYFILLPVIDYNHQINKLSIVWQDIFEVSPNLKEEIKENENRLLDLKLNKENNPYSGIKKREIFNLENHTESVVINLYKKYGLSKIKKIIVEMILYKAINSSGLFFTTYYLQNNPDVVNAKVNPVLHYIRHGDIEGRKPNPLFDPSWYRNKYHDIKQQTNINTLYHYYRFGAKEGRDPSEYFSTLSYLNKNSDVRRMNNNPLTHYLLHGIQEGRRKQ